MKKIVSFLMVMVLAVSLSGCGGKKEASDLTAGENNFGVSDVVTTEILPEKSAGEDAAVPVDPPEEPAAEPPTAAEGGAETGARDDMSASAEDSYGEYFKEEVWEETEVLPGDIIIGDRSPKYEPQPQSGILTAGEWNDNKNWDYLMELTKKQNVYFPSYGINPMKRIAVQVTNGKSPVKDAKVVLYDKKGAILWQAVSDYEGCAYVFWNVFDQQQNQPGQLEVSKDGNKSVAEVTPDQQEKNQGIMTDLRIELKSSGRTKNLDIMFIFDTTGSMGDELSYLQKEFETIAHRVGDNNTSFSVNFYRDLEDEYVIKSNDFTKNIKTVSKVLEEEYADGGGDYMEAVEEALWDGVFHHKWSDDSTKLLFLILDAPPHETKGVEDSLRDTIAAAAEAGIRMIPIASSGVDKNTEFLLRSFAILTGGTYTFLTDHSGVGNAHMEPTIGQYRVEYLDELIIRLILQYHGEEQGVQ